MTVTIRDPRVTTSVASFQTTQTVGLGCISLFLLPFAAFGLFAAGQALRKIGHGSWREAALFGLFALVFGGVGVGGWALIFWGHRRQRAQEALRTTYPEEPWRWREDWAAGRVEDVSRGTLWMSWLFAGFWNLIGFPAGFLSARAALQQEKPAGYLGLLFPLVGVGLLVWAVRNVFRYRRYGISRLELSTMPGVIGHTLAGVVWVPTLLPADVVELTLTCVRRVTTGSGDSRSSSETILWQDQRTVRSEPSRNPSGTGTRIPVAFRLPADAQACDSRDPEDSIIWRLQAQVSVPGVDYSSVFEVPVFRTPLSDRPLTADAERSSPDRIPAAEFRQPADSRIHLSSNARGIEVVFPAARNPGAAIGATAFTVLWLAITWCLVHFQAPLLFPLAFGGFGLLLVYGMLELWLGCSRVTASREALTIATGYLSPVRERRVLASEIADVTIRIGMQAGSTPYYDVVVQRNDGKNLTAGRSVRDKREAEWLAARIKSALRPSPS